MSVHPEKSLQQIEYDERNPTDLADKKISGDSEKAVFYKGLRYVFSDFATWTSTHGLPHIALANVAWLRLFWVLVVIAALGGCVWQLVVLIMKYLSYGVNTDTELQYSERVYPVVTICNLNPWKLAETTAADADMKSLINAYNDQLAHADWGFDAGLSVARQQQADQWTNLFSERLLALGETTNIGYTYDDLVISCTFNAKACNLTDFIIYPDATYGQCQQFNFDGRYMSTRAGPLYGLRMVIRVDQAKYLPWTDAAGVVIVITSQDEDPYPDVAGYFAAPGTASSMGVRYTQTESQPAPYGTCTQETMLNTTQYNGTYCVEACYRACLQAATVSDCDCYDPSMPHADDGTPSCDNGSASLTQMTCINQQTSTFNVITQCSCPQPCDSDSYTVTVSTAQWPATKYTPTECTVPPKANDPWTLQTMSCLQWYNMNTLLVEIYYEMMNFQVLTESPSYTLVNLIADLGGQIGLFLGMSIISGLEIVFLVILLCCYCCTHKQRKSDMMQFENDLKKARDEADAVEKKTAQKENGGMYGTQGDPLPPAVTQT